MSGGKSIIKYYLFDILILSSLYLAHVDAYFEDIFSRNTIITHPQTGLFLSYVGLYSPAETIIHNSAIFPMTTETCYLLPLSAATNISSCNISSKRYKRFLSEILCLGIGTAGFRMSQSNKRQLKNIQKQIKAVEQSLSKYSDSIQVREAHLAKLESNQILLSDELRLTQQTLNAMLPILTSHSDALKSLKIGIQYLYNRLEHSSLYLAISQIFRNELNLNYLSPEDLKKVVYDVIHQGNITFNSDYGSIPVIQILTKLLVRQQIDFIPRKRYTTENPDEIGRLVITNFFAIPKQDQVPFQIYKLLTVPFVHNNETIQLTHIPQYWGINPANNATIEWYDVEEAGCSLDFMPSCRDTPPLQKLSQSTCLGQIINGHPPIRCQTIVTLISPGFLRQLRDNFWVSSSPEPLNCFRMSKNEYLNAVEENFNMTEHLSLPSVAVINVTPGYVITCPRFTLIGHPHLSNASSLVILHRNSFFTNNVSILDVERHLKENTAWFDRQPFKLGVDGFIHRSDSSLQHDSFQKSHVKYILLLLILVSGCIFFAINSGAMLYIYQHQR